MSNARVSMLGMVALAGAMAAGGAVAQAWPAKPIRMVVPFPVGGGSDSTARILSQRLQDRLKQQIIVENRTGAGGAIGTEFAARAAPDGYTILLGSASEIVMLPAVASKLSFDPLKDFVAIARVADGLGAALPRRRRRARSSCSAAARTRSARRSSTTGRACFACARCARRPSPR